MKPLAGTDKLLEQALVLHREGRFDEAADLYERFLNEEPTHADALHLSGVLALQRGLTAEAIRRIEAAIAQKPRAAIFHSNLAEAYRTCGDYARAVTAANEAIRIDPRFADGFNNLGLALLSAGQVLQAQSAFEAALRIDAKSARTWNNLGNAQRLRRRRTEALACYRRAVEHAPGLAQAHSNLGQLLVELDRPQEALEHCREAVLLQPGSVEAHNNLGNALRELSDLEGAEAAYRQAMLLAPQHAMPLSNLGQLFHERGDLDEAAAYYQRALDLDPRAARTLCHLASVLEERELHSAAASRFARALEIEPDLLEALVGLGEQKRTDGHTEEARSYFNRALAIDLDFAPAHRHLGTLAQETGDLGTAERCFRQALQLAPRDAGTYRQLANLLGKELPQADLTRMEDLLRECSARPGRLMSLHFGLANVRDARREYDQAAFHLEQANALQAKALQQRRRAYDPIEHERFVDALVTVFNPDLFERLGGVGSASQHLVFIVGLPRSGTTLTEQVLASLPQVHGAGELPDVGRAFTSLPQQTGHDGTPLDCLRALDATTVLRLSEQLLADLRGHAPEALRIVDKMPNNYLYLGFLAILLPQARFIHCRRDLRDIATSCWATDFTRIQWASDRQHLATRFEQYVRIMRHWRDVLPVPVLDVDYETMVEQPEETARRLTEWIGVDWDDRCLRFFEQRRPVRTASVTQVRRPIYKTSLARWRHYESHLGDLFRRLETLQLAQRQTTDTS